MTVLSASSGQTQKQRENRKDRGLLVSSRLGVSPRVPSCKFSSVRRPPILVPPVCRLLRRPTPPPRRLEKPNPRQAHCLLGEIVRRHGLHLGRWDNSHRRVTLPAGNSFNRWFVSPQGHGARSGRWGVPMLARQRLAWRLRICHGYRCVS